MNVPESLIHKAKELFSQTKDVVITNHVNPDGDAMGSALALYSVLKSKGYNCKVIVPNAYADFLKWMESSNQVLIYEKQTSIADELISAAGIIIHLDYNALHRSGPMQQALTTSPAKRVLIDHHQQPDDFPEVLYSDTSMSSTAEMVFHFLDAMGWSSAINKGAADALYTGIMTDTGGFRFSSTSPETHRVAAKLLEIGVKPHELASKVYDTNTEDRLKLLSRALERMELLLNGKVALISLSAEDLTTFNYKKGDTEGFVNYGLSLLGVSLSVFVAEKEGKVKMSFRSKGNLDVNRLARNHFNGGGHQNAAGGISELGFIETLHKVKEILPMYEEELENV